MWIDLKLGWGNGIVKEYPQVEAKILSNTSCNVGPALNIFKWYVSG